MDMKELIESNIEFLKKINDEETLGKELSESINEAIMYIENYRQNQQVLHFL